MPENTNISIRVDAGLKGEAEQILSRFGMTVTGAVNLFLQQIVRERTAPLSFSSDSDRTLYADLLAARTDRDAGYIGRSSDEVLADMRQAIERASRNGEL